MPQQSSWSAAPGRRVSRALLRSGWIIKRRLRGGIVKRHRSSHRILLRPGWPDYVFAFHDNEEIGPRMLARIAKHTGLRPDDL